MANEVMMNMGEFRFALNTAAYQELSRTTEYRWSDQETNDGLAAIQFMGLGKETLDLNGVIYPHFKGGLQQIQSMRAEAAKGVPLQLSDSLGNIHGFWVIKKISETQSEFLSGGVPRKMTFSLAMEYYGDSVS